jgi:CO dehydrogenase/acetyl-CoA synthase gamma subunit (corrinoid Fe-S protein)
MAVQQEMAEIYPPYAEEVSVLLTETDCGKCGFAGYIEFGEALIGGQATPSQCSEIDREFQISLDSILALNKDPIPYNVMMEQVPCTLHEIHSPGKGAPLLVTSNFQETVRIMREILERTATRSSLLPTFTHGYSINNAVHKRMFKATEVFKALKGNAVEEKVGRTVMVIPGLAEKEKNAIRQLTGWGILVGPVSGFLAPLFVLKNREAFL